LTAKDQLNLNDQEDHIMFEEFETEYEDGDGEFEFEGEEEFEGESEFELESPLEEVEEMELASELLEVSDEEELEQFLGKLIRKASRAVRGAAEKLLHSRAGRALRGLLKNTARKALPIVGRAVGTYFGGPSGAAAGGKLASTAGRLFGLELEGMSGEDQEFEVARRFVRLGASAAQKVARAGSSASPNVVRGALAAAARTHAPGLLAPDSAGAHAGGMQHSRGGSHASSSGRWVRRGRRIVVFGA
jgi:hypothetical protein